MEEINQSVHVFREILFVDAKNGTPMLRRAIDLMFVGHFAPFLKNEY